MRRVLSLLLRKPSLSTQRLHSYSYIKCLHQQRTAAMPLLQAPRVFYPFSILLMHHRSNMLKCDDFCLKQLHVSDDASLLVLKTDSDVVRFSIGKQPSNGNASRTYKRVKMSRKAKLNELRLYRLKAKKKLRSPNPEVRIRYKLEKAKRKEAWLIEKLRKYEILKAPCETHDPEILTEEETFYLKRTGDKKKNYVPVGRRGVFGGVVLNMHLHWKRHETVKVICKACKLGQVDAYAEELARLSKGIVIDIKPNNTILFYRGRNYVQPEDMSPPDTLSKNKVIRGKVVTPEVRPSRLVVFMLFVICLCSVVAFVKA